MAFGLISEGKLYGRIEICQELNASSEKFSLVPFLICKLPSKQKLSTALIFIITNRLEYQSRFYRICEVRGYSFFNHYIGEVILLFRNPQQRKILYFLSLNGLSFVMG